MNELSRIPRVIAITGGKGGVGKTSIAINLAIALSRTGSKVCLFDGDTSLANTNVMLGLYPSFTLEHLFTGERSIQEIVINGPEGIQIVPGASGVAQCVELDVGQQQRLVTSIRSIEKHYDYMLVDTAAGIGPTVLHFIAASQIALIVITPEPTSLTDAFSLLKVLKRRGYRRRVQVVVNMAASPSQAKKAYLRFSQAVDKYLALRVEYLGSVWMDESMRNAVSTQRPVALFPKTDPSARCFYRLAENIERVFEQAHTPRLAFSEYWQKVVERQYSTKKSFNSKQQQTLPKQNDEHHALTQVQKQLQEKVAEASLRRIQAQGNAKASTKRINVTEFTSQLNSENDISSDAITVEPQTESSLPSPFLLGKNHQYKPTVEPESVDAEDIITVDHSEPVQNVDSLNERLNANSENEWLDLRLRMNHLMADPNTTPEQFITLFSSAIYSFGNNLGNASVDLLHGLLHSLEPEKLTDEQKQLLLSDYERIGLDKFKQQFNQRTQKARYDAEGFGDQQALVQAIRSSAADVPLESLLESIKYASLVDSSD